MSTTVTSGLRRRMSLPGRQRGAALLLIMLVILVAATATVVSKLSADELNARRLAATASQLAAARSALLAHAAVRPDMVDGSPVLLPCPDLDDSGGLDEGTAHEGSCGIRGETVLGRVPWRTLGIEPPRDSSAACLWYVVSGSWKEAGTETAAMVNPDSNGQLQVWGVESAAVAVGGTAATRPVAAVLAPGEPLPGQMRPAPGNRQCSASFNAANFLDSDIDTGINNAVLSGVADGIDFLAVAAGRSADHNDRIAVIARADLEAAVVARPDFETNMRALGSAVAGCIADYARNNSGGASDRRMPWPAPLQLVDYRDDASYDDASLGVLSGRVPDIVDDSNAETGNAIAQLLTNCSTASVPQWSAASLQKWRHWKDHFFYVVAEDFAPDAAVPSTCSNCGRVNSIGNYAAIVVFSNTRLDALAQVRNAPPVDADTRGDINNYLEAANAAAFPHTSGALDLVSQPPNDSFNDILFCIDETLAVSEC